MNQEYLKHNLMLCRLCSNNNWHGFWWNSCDILYEIPEVEKVRVIVYCITFVYFCQNDVTNITIWFAVVCQAELLSE